MKRLLEILWGLIIGDIGERIKLKPVRIQVIV